MTPHEFWESMYEIKINPDLYEETRHIMMDDIMCSLLRELGYGEGVDVFEDTGKWYA